MLHGRGWMCIYMCGCYTYGWSVHVGSVCVGFWVGGVGNL